ncbi:MAG: hypothetical protein Q9188_007663 [Gyalolechia gomerana]
MFPNLPSWLALIASGSKNIHATALLEARPLHAHLIRRSLIQREIIFSGEGLTLLTIDHIYTFKKSLLTLSDTYEFDSDYRFLMASCTRLLRRINTTYTGVRLSKSYLERAYGTDLRHSVLQKVHKAYLDSFGEPGVQDLAWMVEDESPCLPELESPCLPELESPCLPELESPMNQAPMDIIPAVDARTTAAVTAPFTQTTDMESSEVWDADMWSPNSDLGVDRVTYPKVPALTKPPDVYPSLSRPSDCDEIATTICSRCLINLEAEDLARGHETTMFLSPEWEDFRRIGLGILKS